MAPAVKNKEYPVQTHPHYSTADLLKTAPTGRTLALWCGGIFLVLCLALFLPWTQNIRSNGTLTALNPAGRPQTLQSVISGRIEKWHVQEGQTVQKGDTLISISEVKDKYFDPQLLQRLNEQIEAKRLSLLATQQKAKALEDQIANLKGGLTFSLNKARNKINQVKFKLQSDSAELVAAQADYKIAQVQLERQEALYQQGLKSLTELESRRLKFQEVRAKLQGYENKVASTRNELQNARIELNSLTAEYGEKTAKAESELSSTRGYAYTTDGELAKIKNEYANTKIRTSFYHLKAPQNGIVVKAMKAGIGETVKEGEAVATILPREAQLAVELFVKSMDFPLIRKGQHIRLQFDGWPALVFSGWPNSGFGTFGGRIAVIDNVATMGKYRILVVPDPQTEPWPEALRIGSGVYGWALLNDVPIWYELWRQLNGFPADYPTQETGATYAPKDKKELNALTDETSAE
ncbi:HlyD family secretion protein [Adhaeribacter radiodurans]|uniref:HlyD family efflux transporter periplasmic adaptor subunit n=1 Tax=Adhaeribacter radiodurans TaxID=2745197 RepID=A0A7L7L5U8_9BACT|nr:HlyD family efflux transporter periplasmic adaptor subunit [Adhaeribacter radiodurans]QMU28188.1 HlyD family efflux transporter periplasmic adaptor subunit [Adhaeribacter radiodurans]